jgi:hypothetical protein
MSDRPKDPVVETPIQRALRLKKAALETRPGAPAGADQKRRSAAGVAAGASKPWMKK